VFRWLVRLDYVVRWSLWLHHPWLAAALLLAMLALVAAVIWIQS
jgi:hypothetical protein